MLETYRKSLVPLDGSELAERALPHAMAIARHMNSRIQLIRVTTAQAYARSRAGAAGIYPEEVLEAEREEARSYIRGVEARLRIPGITIVGDVLAGHAATVIIDYARQQGNDLIVMSTHGRSGVGRWVHGSVTQEVLRSTPCCILVVNGQHSAGHWADVAPACVSR